MSAIKQLLTRQQENEVSTPLARQLWPEHEPVMTAVFSHFDGSYPDPAHERTCKTHWYITGQGHKAKGFSPVDYSLWRGYTMQGGELVAPCEHCRHKRAISFCKRIERASRVYIKSNLMRWQQLPNADVKRLADRIRKRNERAEDGRTNYTTFPIDNSLTILLHDAPDIGGEPLPDNRAELYELVATWVMATPKGRRAGHGLGKWGLVDGTAGEEGAGGGDEEKPAGGPPGGWRLIGKGYGRMATLLGAYLDTDITAKGAKLDLDLGQLLDFLHEAGIDYAIDGELPEDVTLNRRKEDTPSAKCDTEGIGEEKRPPEPLPIPDWMGQGGQNAR